MDAPIEGEWYWTRGIIIKEWFIAKRDSRSTGGWTNEDTWEDFNHQVIEWRIIPRPPTGTKSQIKKDKSAK